MAREEIIKNGFYTGNLSEINPILLDKLETLSELRNPNLFTRVTHSYLKKVPSESTHTDSLEEADKVVEYHLEQRRKNESVWQVFKTFNMENNKNSILIQKYIPQISELFIEVFRYCYPEDMWDKIWDINSRNINLTNFTKGCYIDNHADGGGKRMVANLLIYCNKDWEEGYGGELVVQNEYKQQPKFGNFAVLDFTHNNPFHSVTPIQNENFNRYTLLTGILYEENYFNSIK
jgi:hypothetical protein